MKTIVADVLAIISANWDEIKSVMEVYGYVEGQWQQFEKQVNYQAFLVIRKQ